MAQHRFPTKPLNGRLIREQAAAQGLPADRMRFSHEADSVVVDVQDPPLSAAQETLLSSLIASHDATQPTPEQQAAEVQAAADQADLVQITSLATRDPATLTDLEAKQLLVRLARRELRRTRHERVTIETIQ